MRDAFRWKMELRRSPNESIGNASRNSQKPVEAIEPPPSRWGRRLRCKLRNRLHVTAFANYLPSHLLLERILLGGGDVAPLAPAAHGVAEAIGQEYRSLVYVVVVSHAKSIPLSVSFWQLGKGADRSAPVAQSVEVLEVLRVHFGEVLLDLLLGQQGRHALCKTLGPRKRLCQRNSRGVDSRR